MWAIKLIAQTFQFRHSLVAIVGARQVGPEKAEHSAVQSVEPVLILSTFSEAL